MDRRSFLLGMTGIIAAPAIVRASSLMPVQAWREWRAQMWAMPFGGPARLVREVPIDILEEYFHIDFGTFDCEVLTSFETRLVWG